MSLSYDRLHKTDDDKRMTCAYLKLDIQLKITFALGRYDQKIDYL